MLLVCYVLLYVVALCVKCIMSFYLLNDYRLTQILQAHGRNGRHNACWFVFFSGRFFELEIVGEDAAGRPTVQRTTLGHSATYRMIYTDLLYYLLCFALPLVSLAFMNWTPETGAVKRKRTFRAETKTRARPKRKLCR